MCAAKSNRTLWAKFISGESVPRNNKISKQNLRANNDDILKENTYNISSNFRGRILGIDPSLRGTGIAVIDISGRDDIDLIFSQTIKLKQKHTMLTCTGEIYSAIDCAISKYKPKVCAAEQTIYVQNFQTAQIMGIARGAVLAAISRNNISVHEYAPLRIKQAICGFGRASKEQVSKMVQSILRERIDVGFDETDAAAAAICCYFTERSIGDL